MHFGRANSYAIHSKPKISRKFDLTTDKKTWTRQNFGFEIGLEQTRIKGLLVVLAYRWHRSVTDLESYLARTLLGCDQSQQGLAYGVAFCRRVIFGQNEASSEEIFSNVNEVIPEKNARQVINILFFESGLKHKEEEHESYPAFFASPWHSICAFFVNEAESVRNFQPVY